MLANPEQRLARMPGKSLEIKATLGAMRLRYFFEHFAWPVLQPGTTFRPNWHIDAICDHLEALKRGEIRKLIINMPFRMLKSTIVSQTFPAWDWIDNPSREFLTASYARELGTRDAVESRKIIESPMFQAAYGDRFAMASDQNVKTRYENDRRGKRIITSTDSAGTGFGGDIRIIDDPVSAKEADSPLSIAKSVEWWKGTMATRANDLGDIRVCVVHQRMNAEDLTGYLLANEKGWEQLILPFRFDPQRSKTTSLGFVDPRKARHVDDEHTPLEDQWKTAELIHPERVPENAAKDMESTLGAYHRKAQLQQDPEPRGGIIFLRKDWKYWSVLPQLREVVLSVDCTFKDLQTSDHVAIQAWGNVGAHDYLLPGRIKERLGFAATVKAVQTYLHMLTAQGHKVIAVLIEDKANGSAVIETLKSKVPGVIPITPDGGKAARAYAMQPSCEAGNVWLPDEKVEPNIEVFLSTCSKFTGADGGDDDEVDAMTQYVNWRRVRNATSGLQDWMREQADQLAKARA